ncbi:glucan biosynthesis protein G [Jannaschia sp. CCS1]|uniref:glucan biosynthesis protein G n=1 Tax=Jannaschia sp. (strain CCS1) TaxID=290400 RepID=UPI00006BFF73|nr:glucan biosynthesis protein G [Jannaschia sp. CCS1]ABD53218.1 periplasmic glucan biosynthesis protein MdoG [Jannaschia sp. CCS1]
MDRRTLLALMAAGLTPLPRPVFGQSERSLLDAARALAAAAYVPPSGELPAPFADLDYNAYRGIRPIDGLAASLPQGEDFTVDLLPPGLYFTEPVTVERRVNGTLRDLPLTPDLFTFEPRYFDDIPETSPGTGFSGMRVRYPLNNPDVMDEVAVFQGASYFRAIGQAMAYGLSARAVALGTGGSAPEEFPRFTHMRLNEGVGGKIGMEALIDSPSLSGHLAMEITPGRDTAMDISVTLFPRTRLDTIGIAPLTSMFLKGPMHGAASDDFRPRVHDSNVLYIENGAGEHLWRPIANPTRLETSAFADTGPACFGLYQTTRTYEDFEDTEARYHERPSALVQPSGDWGPGAVMLVEIPTSTEFLDNIVAFWRPEAALEPGGEYRFDYRLTWTLDDPTHGLPAPIVQSRSGREHEFPTTRRFVIDFDTGPDGLMADVSAFGGAADAIAGTSVFALPDGRGTRVTFVVTPGEADALELRLVLRDDAGAAASPVWLHRWTRKRDGGV